MASVTRMAALTGIAALLLTGCSVLEQEPSEPEVVESEKPAVVDEVTAVLAPLVEEGESLPTSKKLFEVLIDAGYNEDQLEATQDDTPLGTGVPAKMFGVLIEEGCVVGEIREGDVTAKLMPPSESTGTCLYGLVDRPEGAPDPSGEPRDEDADDNGTGHIPGEDFSRTDDADQDDSGSGDSESDADSGGSEGAEDGSGGAGLGGN